MVDNVWIIPFLPLLGALIAAVGARRLKGNAHWPVAIGVGSAFVCSLFPLAFVASGKTQIITVCPWIDIAGLSIPLEFRVDGLTTMMVSMVTFVATLIVVFASGYMKGDPAYPRFFALMGLFVTSMTGLVLSNNYVVTYGFWEGVGTCSYLLVGFWHTKPAAAAAAKKAFLVNRVGDVGFAIAIFWMWTAFGGSLSYDHILNTETLSTIPDGTKFGIALLLFWAATAKSAQLPLYVWLPDAMEGPTPVSALIHAATMVTAGVYLIARSSLLLIEVPEVQAIIAIVACATALLAALIALTQNDLKRVMAYSTVSQLGYMFMGLGAGIKGVAIFGIVAAMFHLFTHAFFKALLFLSSGSVMHSMGNVIDMRRFGGLRHRLPWTFRTFTVGALALCGLPPLAAFFSKDEVLSSLKLASKVADVEIGKGWGAIYFLIYLVAVFTAFLTAFYTGRALFMTFFGPEKLPSPDDPEAEPSEKDPHAHGVDDHGHHEIGHESPPTMVIPLMVLAVCAIFVGLIFGPTGWFEHHIAKTPGFETKPMLAEEHGTDWTTMIFGTLVGVAGLGLSWTLYGKRSEIPARLATQLRPLYNLSLHKFWVDQIYQWIVVKPLLWLSRFASVFDRVVIDGLVNLVARMPRAFGGEFLAPFQNGLVQFYAAATALVVAGLLAILLFM